MSHVWTKHIGSVNGDLTETYIELNEKNTAEW